tara:strand:+ start:194 stop:2728 length:2535 start_codon:yes stop_codon:yes gene_type:complete
MPTINIHAITTALLACSVSLYPSQALSHISEDWTPANLAGDTPSGVLRYQILGDNGEPGPARLTFIAPDGSRPDLFPNDQARPNDLAVRRNVVYTLSGSGAITVPVGTYQVWASRGMEYGIESRTIEINPYSDSIWTPRLERELDTTGWVSGDFHLHTLTHSGHGDSNMPERVISLIGEGVEFAVATDHNHNTDYEPTMRDLGVPEALRAIVGNEVSTPIGHFNAFPLDADEPIIDPEIHDGHELFKIIREQKNDFGTVPVVQVNHPRWGGIDYFGSFGLDPVTATSTDTKFSYDFDSVEIFNENEGWGYIDADERDLSIGSGSFSVLRDWFNLLNRGHRIAAVGNSDSHDVASELAGWPRNYIASSTDLAHQIDPAEIAANIRAKRVYTTYGPIVDFSVNGVPMGGDTNTIPSTMHERDAGWIDVAMRVRVPTWIDCDRVMIVVNGEIMKTIDVSEQHGIVRLDTVERLELSGDSWVSLLVEGDDPLDPIVHTQGRPIYPWAVLNPVWVDVDNDGRWTAPVEQARRSLRQNRPEQVRQGLHGAPASAWECTLIAAAEADTFHPELIRDGLRHDNRRVRLAATGALQMQLSKLQERDRELDESQRRLWLSILRDARALAGDDEYLRLRLLLALNAAGDETVERDVLAMLTDTDERAQIRNGFDTLMSEIISGSYIFNWSIAGYFKAPSFNTLQVAMTPAELNPRAEQYSAGEDGEPIIWRPFSASSNGYIDLKQLDESVSSDNAIVTARVWFESDGSDIAYTFGADDASRVMLNNKILYEDHTNHSANPLQHVGTMKPRQGLNLLTVSIENGSGGYGFYLRLFDDEVLESISTTPPETISERSR